ncbi:MULTISPECIES: sugar kinase [unclassified Agarivorans]|uniref:sugar kinase n=1 Tax=unclassified Agarivorans TaxID=2636026 RepID=UPI0026E28A3A|nr:MULTISPECIES: sugar kinase [unclassified Agarivorans]MDO6684832.1 sugar kinase [Agarivorans sp. 3_MG-2023]MDO6715007.1 sugar kinase [Agarivorans sp. 2_MG-2023]MDO6764073.1 sugar kinase [Agarivorans sp. 1_MG-2023]
MTELKVAFIGECMVELQQQEQGLRQSFGGDTLNTAVYFSRISEKAKASYVTALGSDNLSEQMIATWHAENIDTHLVQRLDDKIPGMYMVQVDETGERSFLYWRNDSAAKFWLDRASEELLAELSSYDVVYLSGISIAVLPEASREKLFQVLAQCKTNGAKVVFDNNFRPALWQSKQQAIEAYAKVLACTHTAMLTFDDEQEIYGDENIEQCIERTLALGVSELVIKRGSKDCLIVTEDGAISVPATKVTNVVDTNAAGDSFAAGYLVARLHGANTEQAALTGHKVAGTVIQHKGAVIDAAHMPKIQLLFTADAV